MNSFYGDVKNGTRVSLIFDKTYSNRKAMEAAISKLGGTVGNKNGDGIYNTRYVLIDYGEKRYCPYMSIKTVNATWYDPTTLLFNNKGPQLYIYNEQTASYLNVKSTDKYDKSTVYYVRMDGETAALDKSKVALTPDYIDENCEYYKNRKIDENEYNGAYHHTVWQKIWCSVGVNSTVTEKYIMVAELDAKAPQFNVIIDAPDDNDVYSLVSKRTSVGKRLPLDTNNLYYKKVNNEFVLASDEDVANWNNESINYNNLTVKELFSSPLFRYSEISSDVYYYKPLETDDVNPTPFIKDQNSLDEYINRLGNIYRSSNYNLGEDKMTYEPVTAGMAYLKSNGIREVKYYYRTFSEDGIISETLFNRFKVADDVLYHKVNGVITAVTEDDIYNKTDKYLQKQPLMNGMGPHVDPIRSTDLDYKLHLPRNWKFNTESDLDFNNAGFDPRKQSYTPNAKNQIYLKKEKSGAVYPVHMTKEGYIAFGVDDETALNSIQIPDAGYYVNNELQYVEQIDQRKFDFVLPEFGNVMSQLWDLVYPRGEWKQIINPSYNDDNYKNGNYYYKEGDYYYKVMPGDNLESDKIYWIFSPAPDDSIDANRYLFVGNDRAPEDYPKTLAELIRYIYDLLGLKTDNDYRDVPSKDTIWGMVNGLIELFGKFTDKFDLQCFVPVRSIQNIFTDGSSKEDVEYSKLSGQIDWGTILTEETYHLLNDNAFGPLYIIKNNDPQWVEVSKDEKFNPTLAYYIKNTDESYSFVELENFDSNITYYTANIVYEKSKLYDNSIQYFRDMNSLWALLREFQEIRDQYQPDFISDNPTSPAHIKNRPKIIFSHTKTLTNIIDNNDYELFNLDNYERVIINTQEELNNLLIDSQGVYYYNNGSLIQVNQNDIFDINKKYYQVKLESVDNKLSLNAIDKRWTTTQVRSSLDSIEYQPADSISKLVPLPNSGATATEISISYIWNKHFNPEVIKAALINALVIGDLIELDLDNSSMKPYRILSKDNSIVKVMSMYDTDITIVYNNEITGNLDYLYAGSNVDIYLNTTFYNSLSNSIKKAIISKNQTQDIYTKMPDLTEDMTATYKIEDTDGSYIGLDYVSTTDVGERNIFLLGIEDIFTYFGKDNITIAELQQMWTNSIEDSSVDAWWLSTAEDSKEGFWQVLNNMGLSANPPDSEAAVRPVFNIDLSLVEFNKIKSDSSSSGGGGSGTCTSGNCGGYCTGTCSGWCKGTCTGQSGGAGGCNGCSSTCKGTNSSSGTTSGGGCNGCSGTCSASAE